MNKYEYRNFGNHETFFYKNPAVKLNLFVYNSVTVIVDIVVNVDSIAKFVEIFVLFYFYYNC